MLYQVKVDGTNILDYNDPNMVLLSPQNEIELDVSGSLEFTIPPNHVYYSRFTAESIMKMIVEVYEDSVLHWFGRPIELHLDFYKNKKIYCEGALGFFNDSIIREAEYEDELLSVIFAAVIAEHNSMVDSNRQFTVGQFTVPDHKVYRKFNYEQTSDVLKSKFLDAEEGHFFLRRENGVNYIDFLKDMPYTCLQNVEFAKNLLNFTYSFDGKDFATCVIPRGAIDEETGEPITIASVNNGSDLLIGSTASSYGKIVKVQNYGDLTDPNELLEEGKKYLTTLQYNAFLVECSAVDLHIKDNEYEDVVEEVVEEGIVPPTRIFRVGQIVKCISNPHGINLELPISKLILYLDSAAKQITIGRIPKKTLSRFYKERVGNSEGIGDEIDDTLPQGYGIIDDPETGEPTLIKVPVTMQIMTLPYKDGSQNNSSYEYGDTLIFDGLTAMLVAKGQTQHGNEQIIYFSDSNYPDGSIPFNELSFDPITYNQHAGKIMVWCTWTNPNKYYNGIKFRKAFYMHSLSEQALEDADVPDHITIVIPPSKLEYYNGEHIDMSGAKVVAYRSNGEPYTKGGYFNGVIPNSELTISPAVASGNGALQKGTITIDPNSLPSGYENFASISYITGTVVSEMYAHGSDIELKWTTNINGFCLYLARDDGGGRIDGPYTFSRSQPVLTGNYYRTERGHVTNDDDTVSQGYALRTYINNTLCYFADGPRPLSKAGYVDPNAIDIRQNFTVPVGCSYPYGDLRKVATVLFDLIPDNTGPGTATGAATDSLNRVQTIEVSWTAPGGNTLTASFDINIKEGGIYSGR